MRAICLKKIPTHNLSPILLNFTSYFSTSLEAITNPETKPFQNPLYTFLPDTHNPNNIVNLICTNLKHNNGHTTSLHQHIQWLLPHLGTDQVSKVLLRCQSHPFTSLNFFNWVRNDLGLTPTVENYCIIAHILAWSRDFALAMKFLSELIQLENNNTSNTSEDVFHKLLLCTKGCNWNLIVFDLLIKAYVKTGSVRQGLRVFKKMLKFGLVPDVSACNYILNGLLKSNRIGLCWKIYDEMVRVGISSNSYTFNILTHVFCKDGDVGMVNDFLEKMEDEGFDPDIVTYNTLIDSYCRKGRLEDAFYLYKIMYRRHVLPDLVTYTALMKALCNRGKVKEAHQLFHRMVHRGLRPDIIAYNSLISGYCMEGGKMQEARLLLQEMAWIGLSPNSFTCRLLVEGYVKLGKLLSALNLAAEFQRLGVEIPLGIYDYLAIALCQENKPYAAESLLRRMLATGYDASVEIYNQLIESFCKCNSLKEAFLLKDEMVEKGLKPDLATYKALIGCMCNMCKSVEGEFLMKEMVEAGLVPDTAICRSLVNGYCKERDFDSAEGLLIYFALEFHTYDTECYNALIKLGCEEGNVTKSLELQDRMLKLGFVPNSLTCKSLIYGLSRVCKDQNEPQEVNLMQNLREL